MTCDMLPLDGFLCHDDDPGVLDRGDAPGESCNAQPLPKAKAVPKGEGGAAKRQRSNTSQRPLQRKAGNDFDKKYSEEHLNAFTEAQLQWPPVMPEAFLNKVAQLSNRGRELLWYQEQVNGLADSLEHLVTQDLNVTFGWSRPCLGRTPCIVSTSTLWVRGPAQCNEGRRVVDRLLTGTELLHLQGLSPRLQAKATEAFSFKEKTDLAGNAFNAAVMFSLITAAVACLPHSSVYKKQDPGVASLDDAMAAP
eukprot:11209724-Lingulodinium_polyedra.AAC.1